MNHMKRVNATKILRVLASWSASWCVGVDGPRRRAVCAPCRRRRSGRRSRWGLKARAAATRRRASPPAARSRSSIAYNTIQADEQQPACCRLSRRAAGGHSGGRWPAPELPLGCGSTFASARARRGACPSSGPVVRLLVVGHGQRLGASAEPRVAVTVGCERMTGTISRLKMMLKRTLPVLYTPYAPLAGGGKKPIRYASSYPHLPYVYIDACVLRVDKKAQRRP